MLNYDDVTWLRSHPQAIDRARELREAGCDDVTLGTRLRKEFGAECRAALELTAAQQQGLRGSAVEHKLPHRDWWVDTDSVQQATPIGLARWRAQELHRRGITGVYDVTCSVGTELAAAHDQGLAICGSDINPARVALARHNMRKASSAPCFLADAVHPALAESAWKLMGLSSPGELAIIADPARRSGGTRIRDPEAMLPPLSALTAAWADHPMVIKCAPGIDYSAWPGDVDIISIAGAVKEATLYSPQLCDGQPQRRAIVMDKTGDVHILSSRDDEAGGRSGGRSSGRSSGRSGGRSSDTSGGVDGGDLHPNHGTGTIGRYMLEPDGAIIRAGLVRQCAQHLQLWMPDEHIAFLSGDHAPAGHLCSEVWDVVSLKQVKSALQRWDVGAVEILVRGVDLDPDRARKKWKVKGSRAATVFVMRQGDSAVAVIGSHRSVAPNS